MSEPDISEFKFRDFDRTSQISLCAMAIEGIRHQLGGDWKALSKPASERDSRLREARHLVKHLIRVASESTDFYRTVDFITREAALTVNAARTGHKKGHSLIGHLVPSSALTHEHMVPGEVVLHELVRAPANMRVEQVLEPLTYRAMVCKKKEIQRLDARDLKSALPPLDKTRLAGTTKKLPPEFKALMRYDVTGLLDDLLPVTTRAVELKNAYLAWHRDMNKRKADATAFQRLCGR